MGEVNRPDVYDLPKYQNDIAHALSRAGGLSKDAGNEIQVHRRISTSESQPATWIDDTAIRRLPPTLPGAGSSGRTADSAYFSPFALTSQQVTLNDGDVIVVPIRTNEVFFVVGKLSPTNFVRFNLGTENRDLGTGFLLPPDRDINVVTAVAMAGYIDPIDSPTTVTVQRTTADGTPMLIHVDLIAARHDWTEDILVQPGDIIYLNPDAKWWFRRALDRVIPDLIRFPYERAMLKAFGQQRN